MIFQSCLRWFCREHAKNAQSVDLLSQGPLANLSRSIMDVFVFLLKGPAGRFLPMCFVYSISNNKTIKKFERLQRLPPMGPKGPIAHPRGGLKPKFVSRPQNTNILKFWPKTTNSLKFIYSHICWKTCFGAQWSQAKNSQFGKQDFEVLSYILGSGLIFWGLVLYYLHIDI